MASVVKRKNSKFWTAHYTARDGRQLKRSAKTIVKNQAMEIAIELERVEHKAKQGELTSAQLKKVLNDVAEKITGDSLTAPSTEAYLNDWLTGVGARSAPATAESYRNSVNLFVANLGEKANKPITAVTPYDVESFLNSRLKAKVAPKTTASLSKIPSLSFVLPKRCARSEACSLRKKCRS